MKRFFPFFLVLILGFALDSCSAKEESPEPASQQTNTDPNSGGGSNGGGNNGGGNNGGGGGGGSTPTPPTLTTSSPIQFWGIVDGGVESYTAGGGSQIAYTSRDSIEQDDTIYNIYSGGVVNTLTLLRIATIRGTSWYPEGTGISEADFLAFFSTGVKPFSPGLLDIEYFDGTTQYISSEGDQTGSTFEITDMVSTGTPAAPKCKVVMKYTCKVYKPGSPTDVKEIKDAVMVAEFAAY